MTAVAVIGGGPAGLMAAETLAQAGRAVTVYERMPSAGRKFLMAGRGGLNLTHSEDFEAFVGALWRGRAAAAAAAGGVPAGGADRLGRGAGPADLRRARRAGCSRRR